MTPTEIETQRFLTDLALPDDVRTSASGDWPTVSGRHNVRSAIEQRALTMPGELVHRPQYGAGALEFVESISSPAKRAELVARLRENLLRDDRLRDVGAKVSASRSTTTVDLAVQLRGQPETESIAFTLGS